MDAIAAVAIGGTSMSGGRGKIVGTFAGVLMFKIISNILTAADAEENYDVRLLRFSDVLADRPDADGAYRYPLCEWERADLPRLHEKVLHGILLPADHRELLVP